MTTHNEALGDYQRYRERSASGSANPPPAAPSPDPAAAAHQAALEHAAKLLTPSYREQQRVAAEADDDRPELPEPRETLREAHRARAAAAAEADRLRSALDRAQSHLAEVTATRDAAQRELGGIEAEHTARLIDELATGAAGRVVEPVAGEQRLAVAEAEHRRDIAHRAAGKLTDGLAAAEQRQAAAVRAVADAVAAVLLDVAEREAEAILSAADELDARRAGLDALGIEISNRQRGAGSRLPWPPAIRTALTPELRGAARLQSRFATPAGADLVQRWSEVAAALAADPEADIEAAR